MKDSVNILIIDTALKGAKSSGLPYVGMTFECVSKQLYIYCRKYQEQIPRIPPVGEMHAISSWRQSATGSGKISR